MSVTPETGNFELSQLWEILDSPVYLIMEHEGEDAVNVANAKVRHFHGNQWLAVDDIDGYCLVDDLAGYCLTTEDDPRRHNYWRIDGSVWRGQKQISKQEQLTERRWASHDRRG